MMGINLGHDKEDRLVQVNESDKNRDMQNFEESSTGRKACG